MAGRVRAVVAVLALATGALVVPLATPASAVPDGFVDTCSELQEELSAAAANAVVTMRRSASPCDVIETLILPERSITLQGETADVALLPEIFIGGAARVMFGRDIGTTTIKNLVIRNGRYGGSGAGLKIQGNSSPTIENVTFRDNDAGGDGGGLAVKPAPTENALTIRNSRFTGNTAGQRGGGLYIEGWDDSTVELVGNTFTNNQVTVEQCFGFGYGGGGAAIQSLNGQQFDALALAPDEDGHVDIAQTANTFVENSVQAAACDVRSELGAQAVYEGDLQGGGELVAGADLTSLDDEYVKNRVTNREGESVGGAEGGGLSMQGSNQSGSFTYDAQNLVLAANVLDGDGEGAGAYFGYSYDFDVTLTNATVVANRGISEGAGLGGGEGSGSVEDLVLRNSIVYGNTSTNAGDSNQDVSGFDTVAANFSDFCTLAVPLTAESGNNICADPKLVDAANGDVHQTDASPTLDAASNALVPSTLTNDYEGQGRTLDAKGDGPTPAVVDMGADEMPAPVVEAKKPVVEAANLTAPGSIGEDDGYCLSARDGGVFTFGGCQFFGAANNPNGGRVRKQAVEDITAPQSLVKLNAPVISIAMLPSDTGYWQAAEDGGVFSFGTAQFHGSMGATPLTKPIIGIASSPTGLGYWLVASDGGVFSFGDAPFLGSTGGITLTKPIVGITATHTGKGYWLVASDGGVFSFGDAQFFGSTGGDKLNSPIVGMASRPGGLGYWLAAADGGVFTFGDAPFLGNRVGQPLNAPVIGMKGAASGNGYWLVAKDGGIFSYGSAPFFGSTGSMKLNQPVIDMTG